MLTIEIDKIDRLYELVNKIQVFFFLSQLISDYKDFEISDEYKRIIRSAEYFLTENNLESVKKLNELIESEDFVKSI